MAAAGARVTARLFAKTVQVKQSPGSVAPAGFSTSSLYAPPHSTTISISDGQEQWSSLDHAGPVLMTDIFSSMAQENAELQLSSLEFPMFWGGFGILANGEPCGLSVAINRGPIDLYQTVYVWHGA